MIMYNIPMENGKSEKGTLNIGAQANLAAKQHDLWEVWNDLYKKMQKGEEINEIEMGKIFYIAYACAHINDQEMMHMDEFLSKLSDNRQMLGAAFQRMFGVYEQEKKRNSQSHFKKRQSM